MNELDQDQKLHDLYHNRLPELEGDLPSNDTELATAYNYYGLALGALGHYDAALTYSRKALGIRQAVLPEDDADLARSYNNVGNAYGYLGKHQQELEYKQKALEYLPKALAILEKALPQEHPHLAHSCHDIAWTYHNLGDFQSAAQFMHRAADIIQRSGLPKTHPDRIDFPKWATEFEKKAEMQRRLLSQPMGWNPNPFPFGKK